MYLKKKNTKKTLPRKIIARKKTIAFLFQLKKIWSNIHDLEQGF